MQQLDSYYVIDYRNSEEPRVYLALCTEIGKIFHSSPSFRQTGIARTAINSSGNRSYVENSKGEERESIARRAVDSCENEISTRSSEGSDRCSCKDTGWLRWQAQRQVSAPRSENVEKFSGLSAGFNAQRSVSTGSHGIITESPGPHL